MMTETVTNQAAWQKAPGQPLRIGVTALPHLAANEILIRNAAIAINPLDWILQDVALLPWLDYPAILGSDVSGEVAAVGGAVQGRRSSHRTGGRDNRKSTCAGCVPAPHDRAGPHGGADPQQHGLR
ncbi:hypothetical protein RNI52_12645 [Labrys neptuniae]|jgi:hypothetical protein|uniref:Alcohol dehydrogenase-like N-terminal domain-containing protein n=1 Tax=Methylobacterium ajmalii TaxID=2738439 RepID=A0ABU9ZTD5_9HYPH|nr:MULTISPECIES: alcohol dehydrogenase catalytic domain-containing protein [Hyphomicrobiales]MDT3378169.1 hypothetical protein [Labrys neptuniae]